MNKYIYSDMPMSLGNHYFEILETDSANIM